MALWMWVSDLDPKNDWLELLSFSWGSGPGGWGSPGAGSGKGSMQDIHVTLRPGRFATRLLKWMARGDARTVYVFVDPQTEYQFSGAMVTALSTTRDGIQSLSINFESMTVVHSGAP